MVVCGPRNMKIKMPWFLSEAKYAHLCIRGYGIVIEIGGGNGQTLDFPDLNPTKATLVID